jgi:protein-S-isoprenylcysteine O-methyltransferase Ste14
VKDARRIERETHATTCDLVFTVDRKRDFSRDAVATMTRKTSASRKTHHDALVPCRSVGVFEVARLDLFTTFLLVLNAGCHLSFIWARYGVFRICARTPKGVRLIEASAAIAILLGLWLIATRGGSYPLLDWCAVLLAFAASGLFAWGVASIGRNRLTAAFSNDSPTQLITTGPFRYVRNPFYLSYILAYLQTVFASRSTWALLPLVWMSAIYVHAALIEERKFLASSLGSEYRRYAARTARFMPPMTLLIRLNLCRLKFAASQDPMNS